MRQEKSRIELEEINNRTHESIARDVRHYQESGRQITTLKPYTPRGKKKHRSPSIKKRSDKVVNAKKLLKSMSEQEKDALLNKLAQQLREQSK